MKRIRLARFIQRLLSVVPARYPVVSRNGLPEQPLFVLGSGRNGSTLLNRMLNQHTALFLPPEQYFAGPSIIKFQLYNRSMIWRDLVKVVTGELITSTGSHRWEFDPGPLFPDLFMTADKSLQSLLDSIYRESGRQAGKTFSIWGDTTPLNIYYLPEIFRAFPGARYIFLLRDGRDVVASYFKGGRELFGDLADPIQSAMHWNDCLRRYEWLKRKVPVNLVRYEELVTQPEETMTVLLQSCGLDFQGAVSRFYQDQPDIALYRESQYQNLFRPVSAYTIGKWKQDLPGSQQQAIISVLQKNLERFGYLV